MKRISCAILATAFFALSAPEGSSAQTNVFVGGGVTIPVADYGELTKTGWQGWGGVLFPVGDAGLTVGAEGFYGRNNNEIEGSKTTLYGGMGLVGWEWGDPEGIRPTVFGGLGFMNNSFKSETLPALDSSDTSLATGVGGGVGFPLGGVGAFVGGSYTTNFAADVTATRYVTFGVSLMIPVG